MEPKAHHVLIGLFVMACTAAALVFALWMGNADNDRSYKYYVVSFNHAVSGLAEGNAVLYSGIKVGDVVKLGLAPDDPRKVRAHIRVYNDIPVKEDTMASLTLANITGSMNIQLSGGTPSSPLLRGSSNGFAVIHAAPSSLSTLLTNGEDMLKRIGFLLAQADTLFSQENIEGIGNIIRNAEHITAQISAQTGTFVHAMTSIDQAAQQAEQTLAEYARLGEVAHSLIADDGTKIIASAQQSVVRVDTLIANLQDLLHKHEDSLKSGLRGVGEIEPVMHELHMTIGNLKRIAVRLEENPARFILGSSSVQEFSP